VPGPALGHLAAAGVGRADEKDFQLLFHRFSEFHSTYHLSNINF
jgi:hypothetical protein